MAGKGLSHNKASEHDLGLFSACNRQHGLPRVIECCGDSCKFQPFQAMSATRITCFNAKQLKKFVLLSYKSEFFSTTTFIFNVACFLLGNNPASGVYMPMFRNTLSVPSS